MADNNIDIQVDVSVNDEIAADVDLFGGSTDYVLPVATETKLGGVKAGGEGLGVNADGLIFLKPPEIDKLGGVKAGDNIEIAPDGTINAKNIGAYITKFDSFYETAPPIGWMVRNGGLIVDASNTAPKLYEALQLSENAWKLKPEAEWQAMSATAGGVGGVPFFVLDAEANTIRLPDTRGDYERNAGSLFLQDVGDWHASIVGKHNHDTNRAQMGSGGNYGLRQVDASGTVAPDALYPTGQGIGDETRTRAFAMLGCVYVGV